MAKTTKLKRTKVGKPRMTKSQTKKFLKEFKATGKEIPERTIKEREAKAEEELDNISWDTKNKWEDNITEDSKRQEAYLLFDFQTDEDIGTTDIPYWMKEINFDTNANYEQKGMNNAMKHLMKEAGLKIKDLPLQLSFNVNADSYLSFASAEADMPDTSLPIAHGGQDGEYEGQYDDIKQMKAIAEAKGVSDEAFKKWFDEQYSAKDKGLYYDRVLSTWVIHIDKNKFLQKISDKVKQANPEAVQTIKEYEG